MDGWEGHVTDFLDADVEDVLAAAAAWRAEGARVAIATLTDTWGSSPRPAGSRVAVDDRGRLAGSVSGGCVEGAVAEIAAEVLSGAPPRLLSFGVTDERAWEVGLACGGKIRIFVEPLV